MSAFVTTLWDTIDKKWNSWLGVCLSLIFLASEMEIFLEGRFRMIDHTGSSLKISMGLYQKCASYTDSMWDKGVPG